MQTLSDGIRRFSKDVHSSDEPNVSAVDESAFSALNLRDRVVIMLLFDQIVTEEQVAQVWTLWQQNQEASKEPLWRLITLLPNIDREMVFEEAARVYGIEEARIETRTARSLIEKVTRAVPPDVWDEMVELRLIPVAYAEQHHSHRNRLILACHDPTNARVQRLMGKLPLKGLELRYVSEIEIVGLLAHVFPWKYRVLLEALEAEQELFEQAAALTIPESPEPSDTFDEEAFTSAPNSSSIIAFFEDMLVKAVREKVCGVCIVPNNDGVTEVYFQVGEKLNPWQIIDHVQPQAFMATIKGTILPGDFSILKKQQGHVITRWIDGARVQFRVTTLPPSDHLSQEAILIRTLK